MQRRMIAMSMVIGAGMAAAGIAHGDTTYVSTQKVVAQVQAEWLPAGGAYYSGNQGEGNVDMTTAWGGSGEVAYEVTEGLEIGLGLRAIGNERMVFSDGSTDKASGTELIVQAPFALHTRPGEQVDFAFVVAPGWSYVWLPSTVNLPDANGFTADFGGELLYRFDGGVTMVASIGYQRGFQRTHEPVGGLIKGDATTAWATDYLHIGVGLSHRF